MGKFCGICRSKEHFTGEHYDEAPSKVEIVKTVRKAVEKSEPMISVAAPSVEVPAEWTNKEGLIDPPVRARGRKKVYASPAARQRAYRLMKKEPK